MKDAKPNALAREWYELAQENERHFLLGAKQRLLHSAFVTAHEAAEKYLKAALIALGAPVDPHFKTHDLPDLFGRLQRLGLTNDEDVLDACVFLDRFYPKARYPGEAGEPLPKNPREVARALRIVRRFVAPIFR